jgi:oligopeptide transport system ATP-binding protein
MYAGFIVERAAVDEVYANPLMPYTAALLRSLPHLDDVEGRELDTIEGLPPDLIQLPNGCPFAARCSFVLDKCREERPPLMEIEPGHEAACWVDMETGELR